MPVKTRKQRKQKREKKIVHVYEETNKETVGDGPNEGLNNTSTEWADVFDVINKFNEEGREDANEEVAGIINDEDVNGDIGATDDNNEQVTEEVHQQENFPRTMRRKTRGPTKMMHLWSRAKGRSCIKLEFNDNGEPVGENAASFSEFVGTAVKCGKDIPIDVFDWRLVPKEKKLKVLEQIKNVYEIPFDIDNLILQSMGKKWRNFKSALKEKYYDPGNPVLLQLAVGDERLVQEQWTKLVEYWDSEKAQHKSQQNKQARSSNKMNHCLGKKSLARVQHELTTQLGRHPSRAEVFEKSYSHHNGEPSGNEAASVMEKMKNLSSQLPVGSSDLVGPNDVYGQIMGKEKRRKMESLVPDTPLSGDLGKSSHKGTTFRIFREQQKEIQKMHDKMEMYEKNMQELKDMVMQLSSSVTMSHNHFPSTATEQVRGRPAQPRPLTVHASVLLKSIHDPTKIVAIGYIVNMNPEKDRQGNVLGPNWCEVYLQNAIARDEFLIRPDSLYQTIGDALEVPIVWPTNLVTRIEGI
ncbi:hypothetical protein M9H77_32898 [Catharanthus roseus]|uniref:Uncharacterized protein n=1 Tax=Catharanthus roseus TaxID=4058 RepID=A0ACC0A861_CATRO|nr:hypothetical protein M9H77_32898 [Catharanthus roseus]